jgi:cholesterol transport system auxiliary component
MSRAAIALAALALLVTGCLGGLQRSAPKKERYALAPLREGSGAGPGRGALYIERVEMSPLFEREGFVYRTAEARYESDFYRQFFLPPGSLVRETLRGWLAASALFDPVDAERPSGAAWRLATRVDELYADLREPAAPRAIVAVAFELRATRAPLHEIAFAKAYAATEAAPDASPAALVDAWSRALARVYAAFETDLRAAPFDRPAARR